MAQRITIPFIGGSTPARSVAVNTQDTVNLIQSVKSQGAKNRIVLESAPGLVDSGSAGDGICRSPSMLASSVRGTKDLYGVFGTQLVAQQSGGNNINVGTLNTSVGVCRIARGRDYVAVVDGTDLYTYDGTTFATTTLPVGVLPTHVVYLDGFFHINDSATDNWYISAKEDPTSVNALDFESAAVTPDAALALAATESLLWVIGDESAQPYYNSGDIDFPYDLALSGVQEKGILAPQSIAESDDGIFYVATTPEGGRFIYRIQGYAGSVVSTDEIEDFLGTINDLTTAYGFIYKQGGKSFYVLQLGANTGDDSRDSWTLALNIKAHEATGNGWERRELQDGSAWRISGHGLLGTKNIGGSRLQATHYELSLTNYQDAGQEMIRKRRTQIYHNKNLRLDYYALIVEFEGGVGGLDNPSNIPVLQMRYSDTFGKTWSDWLYAEIGAQGEDDIQRAYYDRLGQSRNRIFEVAISDNAPLTISSAYVEAVALND